jgi:hypothetical protein
MMKKATLQFLQLERDALHIDISLLESGAREVLEVSGLERRNITRRAVEHLLQRMSRFEEMIAAYEARLA